MPTTPRLGLPYPALGDPPSGPLAVGNLATAIDDLGVLGGKRRTAPSSNITTVESVIVDTQTLAMAASSVFRIDAFTCFTVSVAATDVVVRIRLTSVSGTILAENVAFGVYASPAVNHGHLSMLYKTTAAELDYFCVTVVRQAGTGNIQAVVPTSIVVTRLSPSSVIGDF